MEDNPTLLTAMTDFEHVPIEIMRGLGIKIEDVDAFDFQNVTSVLAQQSPMSTPRLWNPTTGTGPPYVPFEHTKETSENQAAKVWQEPCVPNYGVTAVSKFIGDPSLNSSKEQANINYVAPSICGNFNFQLGDESRGNFSTSIVETSLMTTRFTGGALNVHQFREAGTKDGRSPNSRVLADRSNFSSTLQTAEAFSKDVAERKFVTQERTLKRENVISDDANILQEVSTSFSNCEPILSSQNFGVALGAEKCEEKYVVQKLDDKWHGASPKPHLPTAEEMPQEETIIDNDNGHEESLKENKELAIFYFDDPPVCSDTRVHPPFINDKSPARWHHPTTSSPTNTVRQPVSLERLPTPLPELPRVFNTLRDLPHSSLPDNCFTPSSANRHKAVDNYPLAKSLDTMELQPKQEYVAPSPPEIVPGSVRSVEKQAPEITSASPPDSQSDNPATLYKCQLCSVSGVTQLWLARHYLDHVKKLSGTGTLESQRESENSKENTFQCCLCPTKLKNVRGLRKHVNLHAMRRCVPCPHCPFTAYNSKHLKGHLIVHSSERPFSCPKCSAKFKRTADVRMHMAVHSDSRPFACDVCPRKFKSKQNLRDHSESHSSKRPFQCSKCPAVFKQKCSMTDHERRIHLLGGSRPFSCPDCPAKFRAKLNLKYHLKVHMNEKPVACKLCPKKFRWYGGLAQHMATHGEKKFECAHCLARFRHKNNLKAHMKIHTGEKPHACTTCPARFRELATLKNHLRTHSNEARVACAHCSAGFKNKLLLRRHLKFCRQLS